MRPDLSTWATPEVRRGPVEYEIGFLGDLMGLGSKDLELDPTLSKFFAGVNALAFNLEGLTEDGERPVLLTQTTSHFRHLDEMNRAFPATRIIAGLANNHVDDVSAAALNTCLLELRKRRFEYLGLNDARNLELAPGLSLKAQTYWMGREGTRALTLDNEITSDGQELLFIHHGHEFQAGPLPEEKLRVREFPASVIGVIGHHSHFPQPIEDEQRFVAWSLGNLAVKYGTRPVNWGIALRLGLARIEGAWVITAWRYVFIRNYPTKTKVLVRVESIDP